MTLVVRRIAIAGDLHGLWDTQDHELLERLNPDGILFVGDLSEGDIGLLKLIVKIPIPIFVILGNHDRGKDGTGDLLKTQLNILGEKHCCWGLGKWGISDISVLGARPCSSGGGYFLSREVKGAFGDISLEESARLIALGASQAPLGNPLIILSHSGPTGLGSESYSPCGRDWKKPPIDWGDKDLSIAIDRIREIRVPDLVVFGHTHHQLSRNQGNRITFTKDLWGTCYLNVACVPRKGINSLGHNLSHFSWVEFDSKHLIHISHRWYLSDGTLAYEEVLLKK